MSSIPTNMAEHVQIFEIPNRAWVVQRTNAAWRFGLIGALVGFVYYPVLAKLVADWWYIPDFSYGFLVPLFSGYLVWTERSRLRTVPMASSSGGILLVICGLVLLLMGVFGAELFLSRVSFLVVAAGLILTFGGPDLLKALRFPLFVLLLSVPIPDIIYSQITFPLQMLASKLASALLPLLGVPVLREGNIICLPSMKLEVAEACSGIRSLMSLFALSIFYGYFLEQSRWKRGALALASIPTAIAANAVRILGTGVCVQYWNPDKAEGFFHEFSGWVMFLAAFICLYFLHRAMNFSLRGNRR